MTRVAAWVGAGLFTAGMSAAVLAGAGTANADEGGPSKHDTKSSATRNDTAQKPQHRKKARSVKPQPKSEASEATSAAAKVETKQRHTQIEKSERPARHFADAVRTKARSTFRDAVRDVDTAVRDIDTAVRDVDTAMRDTTHDVVEGAAGSLTEEAPPTAEIRVRPPIKIRPAIAAPKPDNAVEPVARPQAAAVPNDPLEAIHDVIRSLGELALNPEPQNYPKPVSVITGVVFDTLATLERVVGGDPVVPPELRDSVEVSTSTLVISEGHEVESNWYFPTSENGEPPTRMIYLQHGFLANGPLYSYTASYLAHSTNSIVVTTTFSSNPFEEDGMWLGGDNLHEAVAQLFLDPDRTALNASMDTAELKAGHAENLDVPMQFVLVGHSLGGGFAPGVAGYYAEGLTRRREQGLDAPNELAGVVIYDAVPMGSIVPDAMERLNELETNGTPDLSDDDPNDYIPIYEIGAPLNFLNVFSDVNDQLSQARPGQFTGVVLEDGVHMDPMQGGNPLIQAAAYLIAGFPQPQNPLAVRELSAGWINDMFDEKIDPATGACQTDCAGQYGDGDESFTITTDKGEAVAVLIGTQQATDLTSLHAISATDFVTAIPGGVLNGLRTTCDLFTGGKCSV
ncbi:MULTISPECIES: hypothetical protein [Mycobacterium]|uniref:Lipocalin family protein n=1 Tax=Mycobacterium syngnathidarum TaxID=1908205 RepID=A0A1S1K772_9MYCO|nr:MULTISPECIES: hypothetical protein [Mycobacterium]MCG7609746.1 hypothetical protein [Mycobacterium sp. CnD-18-1]OHU01321.1 hypothetical protein BKG61_09830 [Mycobacterium syngnathidarum]OLT95323.1 hypothetical protein BKG60_15790 [Mycobacterium syngnathidarum]